MRRATCGDAFFYAPERSFINKNPSLQTCRLGFLQNA